METARDVSPVECLGSADRLLRLANEMLATDAATIEASVEIEENGCHLQLLEPASGWRVVLAFRETEPSHVRRRVVDALRLRSWSTAPPVVNLANDSSDRGLSA